MNYLDRSRPRPRDSNITIEDKQLVAHRFVICTRATKRLQVAQAFSVLYRRLSVCARTIICPAPVFRLLVQS